MTSRGKGLRTFPAIFMLPVKAKGTSAQTRLLEGLRREASVPEKEKKQTAITKFTTIRKLNCVNPNRHAFSSLPAALVYQQVTGRLPRYKEMRMPLKPSQDPNKDLGDPSMPAPKAHILLSHEISPTSRDPETVLQQGSGLFCNWSSQAYNQAVREGHWKIRGGTPVWSDQETSRFLAEHQNSSIWCEVQKFDHFGGLVANGYSHGEIHVHDSKEFPAIYSGVTQRNRIRHSQDGPILDRASRYTFNDCNLDITRYPLKENEGFAFRSKLASKEEYFVFHTPLIRFSP